MKRVKVQTAAPPVDRQSILSSERLYTVALGNHVVVRFTSQREALAFQAEATRFVTDAMMELNILLGEVYVSYRMAWPYLSSKEKYYALFQTGEQALERATLEAETPNAVFLRWNSLSNCADALRSLTIKLHDLYAKKTYAVPRAQMSLMLDRINRLADALRHYGTDVDRAKSHRPSPYNI